MPYALLPRVWALSPDALVKVKERLATRDPSYSAPLAQLTCEADQALQEGPFSVTHKAVLPPSGNKHDYMTRLLQHFSN